MVMKHCLTIVLFILSSAQIYAQQNYVDSLGHYTDSLKRELIGAKEDTNKINLYSLLARRYQWDYPDSAIKYGIPGLELARELNFHQRDISIFFALSEALSSKGNFPKALQMAFASLQFATKSGDLKQMSEATLTIGNVYFYSGEYQKALEYYRRFRQIRLSLDPTAKAAAAVLLGETFFNLNQLDSALYYLKMPFAYGMKGGPTHWAPRFFYLGKAYLAMGQYDTALRYFREGIAVSNEKLSLIEGHVGIAGVFKRINPDSAIYYAKQALVLSQETGMAGKLSITSEMLANLFVSANKPDSAFKYFELGITARDSLYNIARQNLSFNEQLNQQELVYEQQKAKNRIRTNSLFGALGTFILVLFFLWRNIRHKQKAKNKIEKAYHELKTTQSQLIQSEKMASLGELTAGIAHEIQNPLNFVNNFSEVNDELLKELKTEADKGNLEEVKAIANDIAFNSEKINHHGKRADAIVKGMLQHSRTSSGQKEPTDINALCDEYLRLAYHGLRAKDKTFNAKFETDFDPAIEKISVVPQDIGRVILNSINNAFYSVTEKRKQQPDGYEPTVTVRTRKKSGQIEISVKDNGTGIPPSVMEKIFQPFFTTKPTGKGTGLGLSLSYDIITNGHGGHMKAESKEGEFAEFIIQLPT